MASESPILITGAGGKVGAVGNILTRLLLKQGKSVRAMVYREDERAKDLRKLGAEVVVGDLLNPVNIHAIMQGCGIIYFGMSVSASYLAATVNVAAAAKHHGVDAFINMSQMTVSQMSLTQTTDSPQQRLHWLAEQVLTWSGLPVVHMRPTVFMDGFFRKISSHTIRKQNEIRLPFGTGKTSPIAAQDVALALSVVIRDPGRYIGSIFHLTGPQSKDLAFYAEEFSEALERRIRYVDIPITAWRASMRNSGLSKHALDHLSTVCNLHRAGRYNLMTEDFCQLTDTRPLTVKEFVRQHLADFNVKTNIF